MTEHDVIVVGAGMAGLACARALTEAGRAPLVLERSHTVGGRVRTDAVDGFLLDHGFQVLPLAYPRGAGGARLRRGSIWGCSSAARSFARRVASGASRIPGMTPSAACARSPAGVVGVRDGAAVLRLLHDGGDETTAADALRRAGVSRATVETFFAPFLRGVFLEERLTTSSRFLDFVLQAFSDGPAALPRGGMGAIAKQLAEGLDIRKGPAVATVGPHAVSLESGEQLRADAVVVATAGLVDEPGHGWNGVTCVYYDAPASPIPGPWLVVNGEGGPINNLCVPSEVTPGYAPPDARWSRRRSSAPASPTSMRSRTNWAAGSARAWPSGAICAPTGSRGRCPPIRSAASPSSRCACGGPLRLRRPSRAPVAERRARLRPAGRGGSARG